MEDLNRRNFLKVGAMALATPVALAMPNTPAASAAPATPTEEASASTFCGPAPQVPDGLFHVFIIQTFADWESWSSGFSGCASIRESYGGQGAEIYRYPDDPNTALVHFIFGSEAEFNEYYTNPELPIWLAEVGAGHPVVLYKFSEGYNVEA